ncbi:MAG: hypothetical protein AAFU65_01490, partial [Pseudomonadota bacterium]
LMVVAAIAIVALPMLRRAGGTRVWPSVAVATLFIYLGSAIAYPTLSNWRWTGDAPEVTSADAALDQLHAAASAQPENPEGWFALGSALMQAQRPGDAVPALERVHQLTRGQNPDRSLLLIDALMMTDASAQARGRVSALVEDLLEVAPEHPKALFYGAELALARNDLVLARERMTRLLARAEADTSPEAERVRGVLRQRLAGIDQRLGGESPPSTGEPSGPALTVSVSLDDAFAGQVAPSDTVFVLARAGAGPPVAVRRLSVADLPARLTLSDADAMVPSHRLSGFETVDIVARVALGGTPVAQSGDISGTASVTTSRTEPIAIVMATVEP